MYKKMIRTASVAVAAAMVVMNLGALADTVTTAQSPSMAGTQTTVNTNGQTAGVIYDGNNIISSKGPTGDSYSNFIENGVFVYNGANYNNSKSGVGPGGNTTQNAAVAQKPDAAQAQAPTEPTSSAAVTTTAAAQVNINTNIEKPEIASSAAVLYDATTNQVLFDKNCNAAMYPASLTKLMTTLLAVEKLDLSATVKFTDTATKNLESGASTAGFVTGDTASVKDTLYAVMLKSACEAANALGETVSGSQSAFIELMNQRAKELGCNNTHFENASGLNGASHYSTAYDLAVIMKAAINNSTLRTVMSTRNYTLPATSHRGSLTVTNGNKMLNGGVEYYEGILGGKTGYTSKAGNCLATAVEKNGHQLIAVVLKSNQNHYKDTKALYEYGAKLIGGSNTAAQTTTAQTTAATAAAGSWKETANGWKYLSGNGAYYKNQWLDLNGKTYFFGSDEIMVTGWKQFTNGDWYYFDPQNGAMIKSKWVTQNGKSYYLQANGVMAKNTVIDNVYQVDANGVYVKKLN